MEKHAKECYEVEIIFRLFNEKLERESELDSKLEKSQNIDIVLSKIPDIITNSLKCPHCGVLFHDYEACLSLKCSSCHKGFCGVCREANGKDVHSCILSHTCDPEFSSLYSCHDTYMSSEGWEKYRTMIHVYAVIDYLKSVDTDSEFIIKNMQSVYDYLNENKIFDDEHLTFIMNALFDEPRTLYPIHDTSSQNLFPSGGLRLGDLQILTTLLRGLNAQ
jgi:hypothetical protein